MSESEVDMDCARCGKPIEGDDSVGYRHIGGVRKCVPGDRWSSVAEPVNPLGPPLRLPPRAD